MMAGPAGVTKFVRDNTRSGSPANADQAGRPSLIPQDSKFTEQDSKRRREAGNAYVKTPRNDLSAHNLTAHERDTRTTRRSNSTDQFYPDQRGDARNGFETDSGHADDSTVVSVLQATDQQRSSGYERTREMEDEAEYEDGQDSRDCQREDDHQGLHDKDMESQAQNLAFQIRAAHESGQVDLFGGNGSSYPPTTIGGYEDDEQRSHASLQAGDAVLDKGTGAIVPQISSIAGQLPPASHDRSRMSQPQVPKQPRRGSRANEVAFRGGLLPGGLGRADVSPESLPATKAVAQPPLQQTRIVVPPSQAQRNIRFGPQLVATQHVSSQPASGSAIHGIKDEPRGDDSVDDEQPSLDYDRQELKNMPYDRLHGESQDHTPDGEKFQIDSTVASESLDHRLSHVKSLELGDQSAYFATLSLQEWEDAGDWFLEKFGDAVKAFRDARRTKRSLAIEVEEKIHERHKLVQARKRNIDEAMRGMQSTGALVLPQGTPRKRQK